jgi:hypothetical protein
VKLKFILGRCLAVAAATATLALASGAQAATVHTTNFIASPELFNGFEGTPANVGFQPSYTENGIAVTQINGQGNDIWTTYLSWGAEGGRAWYPNGGDFGYTSIMLQGAGEVSDISFLAGSGFERVSGLKLYYELALDGNLVQSGTLDHEWTAHWVGFSGGGFDEVRVRDSTSFVGSLSGGLSNALAIDSIKVVTAVPEPEIYAMLAAGLGLMGFLNRRRRRTLAADRRRSTQI